VGVSARRRAVGWVCSALCLCVLTAANGQVSRSRYLYTAPDPSARGGIRGTVAGPGEPLSGVFALPPDEPRFVYKADLTDSGRRSFAFTGLPVAKYDLVVVFENAFYEGLRLDRGESGTLTAEDRRRIGEIIEGSEPFFNRKVLHRLQGVTGRMEGRARAICTFVRTKGALGFLDGKMYPDHRRSLKLVLLEDVGPGWQVVKTREIYVTQIPPDSGRDVIRHVYTPVLTGIRVVDKVKDLGELTLASREAGD